MLQDRLYRLRRERGLSQEELAAQLGVSRQAVQKWESGVSQPSLEKLTALARYFDVTLDWLVTGQEPSSGEPADSPEAATVIHHYHTVPAPWGWRYEYKSRLTLWGLPLVHVNVGYGGRLCRARGVIAVGNAAVGVVAVGGFALGLLSAGGLSAGLLALGGLSLGLLSLGGVAVGGIALGGVALGGLFALGGAAIGDYAVGGAAMGGKLAIGGAASGAVAVGQAAEGAQAFLTDGTAEPAAVEAAVRAACQNLPGWAAELLVRMALSA